MIRIKRNDKVKSECNTSAKKKEPSIQISKKTRIQGKTNLLNQRKGFTRTSISPSCFLSPAPQPRR